MYISIYMFIQEAGHHIFQVTTCTNHTTNFSFTTLNLTLEYVNLPQLEGTGQWVLFCCLKLILQYIHMYYDLFLVAKGDLGACPQISIKNNAEMYNRKKCWHILNVILNQHWNESKFDGSEDSLW